MTSREQLGEILAEGDEGCIERNRVTVRRTPTGYSIRFDRMYESPALNVDRLMQLVELFGTKDIDVDAYSERGCESCDWGSAYGHEITVKNPTKATDIEDDK